MQQSEIISLAEKLIPVYHLPEFEAILSKLTSGASPSLKLLVKMELKRLMAPCSKSVDLRGRVQGECREYRFNDKQHWFDDMALNTYHQQIERFGSYTEGVWEALINTHNNFKVMQKRENINSGQHITNADSLFEVEPLQLGYNLQRKEGRLQLASQVEITLPTGQHLYGLSIDLSNSGACFKVPSALDYHVGDIISVIFTELSELIRIKGINQIIQYRILKITQPTDNKSIKLIRVQRLSDTSIIEKAIELSLDSTTKKIEYENQDKFVQSRILGYEHCYLKHTTNLPLFFSGHDLQLALLTENNHLLWQYWHDERNQQSIGSLFNPTRMASLLNTEARVSSYIIYTFTHIHQEQTHFYSMLSHEANDEQKRLFWHTGAQRDSWRVYRLHLFQLNANESQRLALFGKELKGHHITTEDIPTLTHCGLLQEIGNSQSASDYLCVQKPYLPTHNLNSFRHSRKIIIRPKEIYFDAHSRRKEPRYQLVSQIEIILNNNENEKISGYTVDLSNRGLHIVLNSPAKLKTNDIIYLHFNTLQQFDTSVPLDQVPYRVIRISPNFCHIQLAMLENSQSTRTVHFLKTLIESNREKLQAKPELLPSHELLELLHNVLLNKMVSTPLFIDKYTSNLRTRVVGVNYPMPQFMQLFANLGHNNKFSLEPIFKGRTNKLLTPYLKPGQAENDTLQFNEIYIAVIKLGERIQSVHSRIGSEFKNIQDRIFFINRAQQLGAELYVLNLSVAAVRNSITVLLQKDLHELSQISLPHARALEKEFVSIIAYAEITDITEEALNRIGITP